MDQYSVQAFQVGFPANILSIVRRSYERVCTTDTVLEEKSSPSTSYKQNPIPAVVKHAILQHMESPLFLKAHLLGQNEDAFHAEIYSILSLERP